MQHLPAYYYRTTLLTLDDDPLFTTTITTLLGNEFQVKSFAKPEELLQYLAQYQQPPASKNLVRDCSEHDHYNTAQHTLVDVDITALYQQTMMQNNINEISVIVSDFDMPEMNGVEVFKRITHIPAKKILLTGGSNQEIAIDAFNDNIIDRYIQKNSFNIADEIRKQARILAAAYFIDQSKPLLHHLEARRPSPLTDIHFADFFQRWCLENHINEYTLIDKNGSFCVRDKHQNERYFIVHTDDSLNDFIELNDEGEVAANHLADIQARATIPFFGAGIDSWEIEAKHWHQHFHPATHLQGRTAYYWSVIPKI